MYRLLPIAAVILAWMCVRAEAVEMFTDFHLGENVGFPPMQVPYGIYGGLGRGGWNPDAEGMPLKTWPAVPSMMPTGQNPGGFRRFSNGKAAVNGRGANVAEKKNSPSSTTASDSSRYEALGPQLESTPAQYSSRRSREQVEEIAATPRRSRWLRGGNYGSDSTGNDTQNAKFMSSGTKDQKLAPTPAQRPTTILHAGQGAPPSFDTDFKPPPGD
ncbi:MAG TPA: hypothetical protein VGJ04_05315 [Pirellulales bacterium]|jgi:hypothetical protein